MFVVEKMISLFEINGGAFEMTTRRFGLGDPTLADVVTTKELALGTQTLAYIQSGSGPAVVIVHGAGGHKEDWFVVIAALSRTHRVFAIDMLGFGESSKHGDDLSMPAQAAAILALLDHEQVTAATLIGNSVGGWVTATFAAHYPSRVEKLVLIGVAGFKAMFEGPPPVKFDPDNIQEMQALIDVTINGPVARSPGIAVTAFMAYVLSGEKSIYQRWSKGLVVSPRLEELLPKVVASTLVLWGADDKLFPSELASVFAGLLADATVKLISEAGHFPQIDQPQATTAAIVDFLNLFPAIDAFGRSRIA